MVAILERKTSKSMTKKRVRVVTYISEELKEELEKIAEGKELPLSNFVAMWLAEKYQEYKDDESRDN
jgi:hypothetical protein